MKWVLKFFKDLTFGKKILLVLAPIITAIVSMKAALIGLAILIFIDLITGIRRTHHEWEVKLNFFSKKYWLSIRSYLLRQTWRKTYEYGIGIIVIAIFENLVFNQVHINLFGKEFNITELAIVFPAIIEIWSIFENLQATGGVNILKRLKMFLPPIFTAVVDDSDSKEG